MLVCAIIDPMELPTDEENNEEMKISSWHFPCTGTTGMVQCAGCPNCIIYQRARDDQCLFCGKHADSEVPKDEFGQFVQEINPGILTIKMEGEDGAEQEVNALFNYNTKGSDPRYHTRCCQPLLSFRKRFARASASSGAGAASASAPSSSSGSASASSISERTQSKIKLFLSNGCCSWAGCKVQFVKGGDAHNSNFAKCISCDPTYLKTVQWASMMVNVEEIGDFQRHFSPTVTSSRGSGAHVEKKERGCWRAKEVIFVVKGV